MKAKKEELNRTLPFSELTRSRLRDFVNQLGHLDSLLGDLIKVLREEELAARHEADDLAGGRSGGAGGESDRDR